MQNDLLKSIEELDDILSGVMPQNPDEVKVEEAIEAHDGAESPIKDETEKKPVNCPYCIKNGSYVKISPDNMIAWIHIVPPAEGEAFFDMDILRQFLTENGVVRGIHESNLHAIAKKHVYERDIVIALGKEPVSGTNGYFEFLFDTSDRRKPLIREDGTVDYTSMAQFSNIISGETIAIYHHATNPENGYDVRGRETKGKMSKELPALKGRGFSNEKDPDVYVATTDGKIEYKNGRIDIKSEYQINGDVDLITGKVEFFGDIHIKGNVGAGVVIRGSRNVVIDGVVEGAEIFAGGDIVVAKGVQGGKKARISANGNISAEFIEFATVEAGGDIRSNSFVNSTVYATQKVIAEGSHGVILGGNVRGLKGVVASNIGNETELKTFVASGYSADEYSKYLDILQKEGNIKQLISETVEEISALVKQKRLGKGSMLFTIDKKLETLGEQKEKYFKALDKAVQIKETLQDLIKQGKGSSIVVNNKIYTGVTVCVEGTALMIPSETYYTRYRNEGGRVVAVVVS